MLNYVPTVIERPPLVLNVGSAWVGLESVVGDIVKRFCKQTVSALEFGVEHGYSTVALSNFFFHVTGVDTFVGDIHSGKKLNHFIETSDRLLPYPNISLVESSWQHWTNRKDDARFDLVHIDIEHTYEETFGCGEWACHHAPVVLFHDTQSFPEVLHAVTDLAERNSMTFYNYEPCYGLGILVRP